MAEQEWYTQQELANMWGAELRQVQRYVGSLAAANVIQTTRNPKDRREVLVHRSGIELVKRAVLGDMGATA